MTAKTMRRSAAAGCLVAILGVAGIANAQSLIGGSLGVSWQPEGPPPGGGGASPSTPTNGIGGAGIAFGLLASAPLSLRIRFGVELSVPTRFDGVETSYAFQERLSVRDVIFSGVIRVHPSLSHLDLVTGVSWVHEDALRSVAVRDNRTGLFGQFSLPYQSSRDRFGLVMGADFPYMLNSRWSVMPQVRVHIVSRASKAEASEGYTSGLSGYVFRPALAVAAKF
jgi:hypothetical protein